MTYCPVALLITSLGWAIFSRKHFFSSCLLCYIRIMTCTWIFLLFSWKWIYVEQWIWFCLNLLHKILSVGNSSKKCSAILHEIDNNISSSIWLYDPHIFSIIKRRPSPCQIIWFTTHTYIDLLICDRLTLWKIVRFPWYPWNNCRCFSSMLRIR